MNHIKSNLHFKPVFSVFLFLRILQIKASLYRGARWHLLPTPISSSTRPPSRHSCSCIPSYQVKLLHFPLYFSLPIRRPQAQTSQASLRARIYRPAPRPYQKFNRSFHRVCQHISRGTSPSSIPTCPFAAASRFPIFSADFTGPSPYLRATWGLAESIEYRPTSPFRRFSTSA